MRKIKTLSGFDAGLSCAFALALAVVQGLVVMGGRVLAGAGNVIEGPR